MKLISKVKKERRNYRSILSVQNQRDEESGLFLSDRFFEPAQPINDHSLFWILLNLIVLSSFTGGLGLLVVSGLSIPVSVLFYPFMLLFSFFSVLVFSLKICQKHSLIVAISVVLIYLILLFLFQEDFLEGASQLYGQFLFTLKVHYGGENVVDWIPPLISKTEIFLDLILIPVTLWLGFSLLQIGSPALAYLLAFPVVILMVLCKAAGNLTALFLLLFGVVLATAFCKPRKQYRMWGGSNEKLRKTNQDRFVSIRTKSAGIMLCVCILMAAPGFLVVRPLLSLSLQPAEVLSMDLQSTFLNFMIQWIPSLTAGSWNLNVEAVGGGVQEGALDNQDGYFLEGVEDLKLTLTGKPKETLFLKGFIGSRYEDGRWLSGVGTTFDGAAMNWKTEGERRLYIQNLPFLRVLYALNQTENAEIKIASLLLPLAVEPSQISVQRLNANDKYTYVPYGVYLNDYYEIDGGDSSVEGQSEQEDRFFFYYREDIDKILNIWVDQESTNSILDRTEESYRSFVFYHNLEIPDFAETLQKLVNETIYKNKWKVEKNLDDITSWIRSYLAQEYRYSLITSQAPEGIDSLAYFLQDSKSGNSVYFASAAVILYRMFGVPARYVVGYEIPASLFTVQTNNQYIAVVQEDQAQAWCEIYEPGIGWMPKDMTPGVIGTFEEVGPGGEKIEAGFEQSDTANEGEEKDPSEIDPQDEIEKEGDHSEESGDFFSHTIKLWGSSLTVEQIVWGLLTFSVILLACILISVLWLRLSRSLGWDPFHRRSNYQRMVLIFQAFYRRMQSCGLPPGIDSQKEEFKAFCIERLGSIRKHPKKRIDAQLFLDTLDALYNGCYGEYEIKKEHVENMRKIFLASWSH